MGKFGWDLPPGCRISDIPGNRPEDQAVEAFYDAFYNQLPEGFLTEVTEPVIEKLADWAWKAVGDSYGEGYAQGGDDERMAQEYNKSKE